MRVLRVHALCYYPPVYSYLVVSEVTLSLHNQTHFSTMFIHFSLRVKLYNLSVRTACLCWCLLLSKHSVTNLLQTNLAADMKPLTPTNKKRAGPVDILCG